MRLNAMDSSCKGCRRARYCARFGGARSFRRARPFDMAPDGDADALAELFAGIGLDTKTAAQVARNTKLSATLVEVIAEAGAQPGCGKVVGNLLYQAAAKVRLVTARRRA
jgi:Glutaminyl-tRNA synthetase, non-specific RNA binding region part 1